VGCAVEEPKEQQKGLKTEDDVVEDQRCGRIEGATAGMRRRT
jgi:hypothetical protein